MKNITDYRGKNVLVFGLATSGFNAAKLLLSLGAKVTVTDQKNSDLAQQLRQMGAQVDITDNPLPLLNSTVDLLVKNPGINYEHPLVKAALERRIPIITEPELAYEVCDANLIGVTGTNGKTTVTTLIQLILATDRANGQAYKAGNIGISAAKIVQKATPVDDVVMELSSFQLMGSTKLRPHIAVITNIYEAHLDYHHTRQNYVAAKMKITANQQADDYLVVNFDQEELQSLSQQTKATVVPFSRLANTKAGAYQAGDTLYFKDEPIIKIDELVLPGAHNIENYLAAIAVAKLQGKSTKSIRQVLTTFTGVEHRIQFVKELAGRKIYNDSKATNVEATIVALQAFNQPIVLIAGGLDRGIDFLELQPYFANVKAAVFYGETKHLMQTVAQKAGVKNVKLADNLVEATKLAYQQTNAGDVLLLSPAAASWDQFETFEERGKQFIDTVQKLD